jgi:hypothetical protein
MSLPSITVTTRTMSVGVADDPYKKYWWAILGIIAFSGAWLCAPMLEGGSVGSGPADPSNLSADASGGGLAAAAAGGAGHVYDLTMGAAARKAKGALDMPESMLFQAPVDASAGAAANGAPIGSASGGSSGSLASALKDVGQGKDPSGWSGENARRGFDAPRMAGGSLSGLGSISGGHGGASGTGAFGTHNAQVQSGAAHGLVDNGAAEAEARGAQARSALGQAAAQAKAAARARSGAAAPGGMNRLFDGARGQNQIGIPGGSGGPGAYSAMDEAPINLKANPDNLDGRTIPTPAATPVPPLANDSSQQMGVMIVGLALSVVLGGLIPGGGGQIIAMVAMMAMQAMLQQQQAQQQAQQAAAAQKVQSVLTPH